MNNAEIILPVVFALAAAILTIKMAMSWPGDKYLCDNCRYNNDDDCKKAERPQALSCTAYRKIGS